MSITAIIVTYNSAGVISSSLSCLYGHPSIAECVVVDNASSDGTVNIIRSQFPGVILIQNAENVGFGNACNQVLEKVVTPYALLFNPDATIDSAGIDRLLNAFVEHPKAAIIAPVLEGSCYRPLIKTVTSDDPNDVMFISGAIALWRMDYMKAIGFFDPAFFMFCEDDDISIRVRRAGYELILISGINARHTPGKSCALTLALESTKLRSQTWSDLYIYRKYHGKIGALLKALSIIWRERKMQSRRNTPWRYQPNISWDVLLIEEDNQHCLDHGNYAREQNAVMLTLAEQQNILIKQNPANLDVLHHDLVNGLNALTQSLIEQQNALHEANRRRTNAKGLVREKLWVERSKHAADVALEAKHHEEEWQVILKGFEEELANEIRQLEEKTAMQMKTLEENYYQEIAKREDREWQKQEDENVLRQMKICEKAATDRIKDLEEKWFVAVIQHDKNRGLLLKKIASKNRLLAALYFLRNPRKFRING